jgi:hypothetical protein
MTQINWLVSLDPPATRLRAPQPSDGLGCKRRLRACSGETVNASAIPVRIPRLPRRSGFQAHATACARSALSVFRQGGGAQGLPKADPSDAGVLRNLA